MLPVNRNGTILQNIAYNHILIWSGAFSLPARPQFLPLAYKMPYQRITGAHPGVNMTRKTLDGIRTRPDKMPAHLEA